MATNVFRILDAISGNLSDLKSALAPLAALTQGTSRGEQPAATPRRRRRRRKASGKPAAAQGKAAAPGRRKRRFSAEADATRRQAGVYGALLRRLPEGQRTQVRKVKDGEGYKAAIALAEKLRKRG